MPPRISLTPCLRAQSATTPLLHHPSIPSSTWTITLPHRFASTVAQKRRRQDPYAAAQARAKKAASLSRQAVIQSARAKELGDPVRGVARTALLDSFARGVPLEEQQGSEDAVEAPDQNSLGGVGVDAIVKGTNRGRHPRAEIIASTTQLPSTPFLNYFVNGNELEHSINHSSFLTEPVSRPSGSNDPAVENRDIEEHSTNHSNAAEALARITALENANSKEKTRVNVQRCIELFGRHNTDQFLRPKPASTAHLPRRFLAAERGEWQPEVAAKFKEMRGRLGKHAGSDVGGSKNGESSKGRQVTDHEDALNEPEDGAVLLEEPVLTQEPVPIESMADSTSDGLNSAAMPSTELPPETESTTTSTNNTSFDDLTDHTTSSSASPSQSSLLSPSPTSPLPPRERAGPDTGSPEVQIAILTSRINTLADYLESNRGRRDMINKRNLRLMVHKRQKMLKYLRRREKGGERWVRCTELLGLGEATWRGEISM